VVDLSYQQSVQSEGPPGRAYPRLPEEVPQGAFGGEIGRGLESAAEIEQRHVEAVTEQVRHTQFTDAHNQMQSIANGLSYDPKDGFMGLEGKNVFGKSGDYLSRYDQAVAGVLANVPDAKARSAAQNAAGEIRNHLQEQFGAHELGQMKAFSAKTDADGVDIATQTAISNYNHPDIIASNLNKIDGLLAHQSDTQGWSPEEFGEARYKQRQNVHQGVLDHMIADNQIGMARAYYDQFKGELRPSEVRTFETAIEAGQVKATANQVIRAYRLDTAAGAKAFTALEHDPNLSDEQRTAVVRQVEQGRRDLALERQQDPTIQRQLTGITDSIALGQADGGTLARLEGLYRQGAVTDEQHLSYRDAIQRAQKKQDAGQALLSYAQDAYDNRRPLDPRTESNAADALLYSQTLKQPPGSPLYRQSVLNIADRIGVIPKSALEWARGNLLGGDPQTAGAAAQLLAELHETAPGAYDEQVQDKGMRVLADDIARFTAAGTPSEKALRLAREKQQGQGTPERKFLDAAWAKATKGTDQAHELSSALSDDPAFEGTGFPFFKPGVPEIPSALAAEYQDLTHEYFIKSHGDMEQAKALALKDLKGVWAVSSVNGKRELMKYAPELSGLSADEVRANLTAIGHPDAHLVETPETGRYRGKVFGLAEKKSIGGNDYWDTAYDEHGNALRYHLPDASGAQRQAQEQARAKAIEKLTRIQRVQKTQEAGQQEFTHEFGGIR